MTPAPRPLAAEARALRDARSALVDAALALGVAERAMTGNAPWGLLSEAERRDVLRGAEWALSQARDEVSRGMRAVAMLEEW